MQSEMVKVDIILLTIENPCEVKSLEDRYGNTSNLERNLTANSWAILGHLWNDLSLFNSMARLFWMNMRHI